MENSKCRPLKAFYYSFIWTYRVSLHGVNCKDKQRPFFLNDGYFLAQESLKSPYGCGSAWFMVVMFPLKYYWGNSKHQQVQRWTPGRKMPLWGNWLDPADLGSAVLETWWFESIQGHKKFGSLDFYSYICQYQNV